MAQIVVVYCWIVCMGCVGDCISFYSIFVLIIILKYRSLKFSSAILMHIHIPIGHDSFKNTFTAT